MQVLQAGRHRMVLLEYDTDTIVQIAQQASFNVEIDDTPHALILDLQAQDRQTPLLLFDAAEPGNLGWFSRCQFYVDGATGKVLQTPISLGNKRDRLGTLLLDTVRLRISRELPVDFRMPGKQPVSEQVIYNLLFNLLSALQQIGVAVCGGPVFQPLSGRRELANISRE